MRSYSPTPRPTYSWSDRPPVPLFCVRSVSLSVRVSISPSFFVSGKLFLVCPVLPSTTLRRSILGLDGPDRGVGDSELVPRDPPEVPRFGVRRDGRSCPSRTFCEGATGFFGCLPLRDDPGPPCKPLSLGRDETLFCVVTPRGVPTSLGLRMRPPVLVGTRGSVPTTYRDPTTGVQHTGDLI